MGGIFPTPGDVNVVRLNKGHVIAWHRHQKQTDYLYCLEGSVTVGMWVEDGPITFVTLTPETPGPVEIEPFVWHGYAPKYHGATILSYISRPYDPEDEQRMSLEEAGIPWPA